MAAVEDRLVIEYVPINQLRPFGGNPRKISEKGLHKLKRSVEEFGFVNPILVQKGTNMIIAGHQRLKAAKAAGLSEVPVVWLDMDDVTAKAYNIADNRLQDEAEWDDALLGNLFLELSAAVKTVKPEEEAAMEKAKRARNLVRTVLDHNNTASRWLEAQLRELMGVETC